MWVYVLNVILVILFSFLIKNKKTYVVVVSLQLFLVLALRSNTLGPDWTLYSRGFDYISKINFFSMISKLHFFKPALLVYPFDFESGYVVLNWLVSHLGFSYHFFLIVCSAINMYSFGKFIYKYSKIPWLSFVILCTFGTYIYFMGILRHSLALSMFILSLMSFLDNKKKKGIVLFILTFLCHRSSIVLLPLLFVVGKKNMKKSNAIILLLSSIPFLLISKYFYKIAYSIMVIFDKGYTGEGFHMNNLMILLYLIAVIMILFVDFNTQKHEKIFNVAIWSLFLSIYLEIVGLYNEVMARSVLMYTSMFVILIPNAVQIYRKQKYTIFIELFISFILIFYMIYNIRGGTLYPYDIQKQDIILLGK